jgi:phosphoglycerate dehydrogenase-like enzyme
MVLYPIQHISGQTEKYNARLFELMGVNLQKALTGEQLFNTIDLSKGY